MKKILLALAICFLFTACAPAVTTPTPAEKEPVATPAPEAEAETEEPAPQPEPEVAPAFPVTVTDQAGREVTIESQPESMISGYYIATSTVIALGLEDKVVAVEKKASSRPVYALSDTGFADLPDVGTMKEFNLETALSLNPELVILPMAHKETADTLVSMGIPAICVNPESQELLAESINLIAAATGTQERGTQLVDYIAEASAQLDTLLEGTTPNNIYLASGSSLLNTAGAKMYQSTLIDHSGNTNVAADLEDTYWATISYEQLLAYGPQAVVLAAAPDYTVEDATSQLADAGLTEVPVYEMPSNVEAWDSPVPGSFLGSYWIASVTHSDVVTPDLFATQVADFYETFYDFTLA